MTPLVVTVRARIRGRWRIGVARQFARVSRRGAARVVRGIRIEVRIGQTTVSCCRVVAHRAPDGQWMIDAVPV